MRNTCAGSGTARSATRSHSPLAITLSISSPASARILGCHGAVLRGLNIGCSSRRYRVCSGGSVPMGTMGTGLPTPSKARFDEKSPGCRSAYSAPSLVVITYAP